MEKPVPAELWMPHQDWLDSTEMTVGQSEWLEAADVSELHRKDKNLWGFIQFDNSCFTTCHVGDVVHDPPTRS